METEPQDQPEPDDAGHPETDPELLELHEVLEYVGELDDGGATGEVVDPLAEEA